MKKSLFMVLAVIGLSDVIVVGSTLETIQPIFASPEQETGGEPQDKSGGVGSGTPEPEPTADPEAEPEAEPEQQPAEDTPTLSNEEQQQQEQLALDIITANGLVPVNETTVAAGIGGGVVTCAENSQGQTFCYELLPSEENCLQPMEAEDPPLCLPEGG